VTENIVIRNGSLRTSIRRWCGQTIDVFVGIDTVILALGDQTVSHHEERLVAAASTTVI
jgi:hypothetical protein